MILTLQKRAKIREDNEPAPMEPGIKPGSVGIFSPSQIFTRGLITMSVASLLPATPIDHRLFWEGCSQAHRLSVSAHMSSKVRPIFP